MTVYELQELYPDKDEREKAVMSLPDSEINEIISSCGTIQGKIYYSNIKKRKQFNRNHTQKWCP